MSVLVALLTRFLELFSGFKVKVKEMEREHIQERGEKHVQHVINIHTPYHKQGDKN
jgi:hypothetical protein